MKAPGLSHPSTSKACPGPVTTFHSEEPSNEPDSTPVDVLAVRAVALDGIEGWYAGDAERMERSLHNDLVKRTPVQAAEPNAADLRVVTKDRMVKLTRVGGGSDVADPAIEVFVDDETADIASASNRALTTWTICTLPRQQRH